MSVTRRDTLRLAGAAVAASFVPKWSVAETMVGDIRVLTVSDGSLSLPADFIFGPVPPEIASAVRAQYGLTGDALTPPCNVTVAQQGDRNILFDAGSGHAFQPTAGELLDALDAAGIASEQITDVIFTHAHPDHLWGVLDDFDDPVFSEAQHHIGRIEFDYWTDPATVDTIGAARQSFAVGAARRLETIADQMAFIEDGQEVLPGVAAVLTPGHTPGHLAFELGGGGESVMLLGDCVGNHHVSFLYPGARVGSDQDPETAAATRVRLMERLVSDSMRLIGFHLPDGGIGRAERHGDGYLYVPET